MTKIEKNVLSRIEKNRGILFFMIISLIGFFARYVGFEFISGDMKYCLMVWFDRIKDGGSLASLKSQVGNYNILYQTLIALMTYLKGNSVHLYKLLSIIFDYLLAFGTAKFVCLFYDNKNYEFRFNVVYTIILMLPTVVFNSGYWGQCDSIYCFFLLMMMYYFYKEKYTLGFVFFGISLGFKFQAAFLLPFMICYYFYKKRFSILNFLLSVAVFWSTGIVGYLYGRNLLEPFKIYMTQSGTYKDMYKNALSFWALVCKQITYNWEQLHICAMLLTLAICGLALYVIMSGKMKMDTPERFLGVAAFTLWSLLLFLPEMHERYTYMLDIILIMMAFLNKRYIKYAIPSVLLSCMTYGRYLFFIADFGVWPSAVYLALWGFFTYEFVKNNKIVSAKTAINSSVSTEQSEESGKRKMIKGSVEPAAEDGKDTDVHNQIETDITSEQTAELSEGN